MSVFRHLVASVQAKHLQSPLGPSIAAEQTVEDVSESLSEEAVISGYDVMARLSLVHASGRLEGWLGFDMLGGAGEIVSSLTEPITADMMVSADMPALELAKLFATDTNHFYFVLQESRITGTVFFEDLVGDKFKLCLFALTLELETTALDLALLTPHDSWSALNDQRQKKAGDVYDFKYGKVAAGRTPPLDRLLACTNFIDKGKILRNRGASPSLLGDINSVFSKADKVRNSCAHTGDETGFEASVMNRVSLRSFIDNCEDMITAMHRVMASS